ncbi:unnamed protein product [Euphydryas editha]|uniref:Uncharacterized protein n=1 Tax=Euphydryas editha TaxID=104508 RepID=A0AAU9TRM4_EUPED|nr:unnamed protein product [Euphydryas editha]
MSVQHSPTKKSTTIKVRSLTDLTSITDGQATGRKRKQPEKDCNCNLELREFRHEFNKMKELLEKIINNQEENTENTNKNLAEIKKELTEVKNSTAYITSEHNNLKKELCQLKTQLTNGTTKIKTLETHVDNLSSKIIANEAELHTLQSNLSSSNLLSDNSSDNTETILREMKERNNRMKNLIIAGIPESSGANRSERRDNDLKQVLKVLSTLSDSNPKPEKIFRLGKYKPEKTRYIKACFNDEKIPKMLLRERSKLDKNTKIFSDQTPLQLKYYN